MPRTSTALCKCVVFSPLPCELTGFIPARSLLEGDARRGENLFYLILFSEACAPHRGSQATSV